MTADQARQSFLPALAGGVALAVHKLVPNQQASEISGIYARFLLWVITAGLFLGFTQRLWRHSQLSWRRPLRLPFAAFANVMRWSALNADVLGVGALLICAWEMITLKLNLMPLPYFPGPDAVFYTLVADWAATGRGTGCSCHGRSACPAKQVVRTGGRWIISFSIRTGCRPSSR